MAFFDSGEPEDILGKHANEVEFAPFALLVNDVVGPVVALLLHEGHPIDVKQQQHLHSLLVEGELLVVAWVLADDELLLPSFVGVDILALWHCEGGFFLLIGMELLLLLELLSPAPKGYPVVALVGSQNLVDDLDILSAQLLGLRLALLS